MASQMESSPAGGSPEAEALHVVKNPQADFPRGVGAYEVVKDVPGLLGGVREEAEEPCARRKGPAEAW